MSFLPYAALWFILVAAAVICFLASSRVRLQQAATLVGTILAFALWLFFRPGAIDPATTFAGRQWVVDETAWGLTGIALLLLLSAAVFGLVLSMSQSGGARAAWLLALAVASLPVVWAGDDRSLMLSVAFFIVAWAAARWFTLPEKTARFLEASRPALWLLAALFPLWLAVAFPAVRLLLMIVAAAILLGVWPFGSWRRNLRGAAETAHGLHSFPILGGAAVLSKGLSAGLPTEGEIALATALGLLSIVAGLVWAWGPTLERQAKALAIALAGLVVLVAVWADDDAMLAATRLALFAPLTLMILGNLTAARQTEGAVPVGSSKASLSPGMVGLAIAYAAVAGLPLTTGFGALSRLHEAWRLAGGWVLSLVLVTLLSLWLAALYLSGRQAWREYRGDRAMWLHGAALILPIIGLLYFDNSGFALHPATWAAIILPALAGAILGRFVPGLSALDEILHQSTEATELPAGLVSRLRNVGQMLSEATADALAILEGDFGLLWLLGFILLLLWIA